MAVAHDAVSESHTGTSPSVSEASFSWTHTPSADPHGVLVFVFTLNFGANFSTNVTYGGVPLIWMNQAVTDAAGEPGFVTVYMLGQGLPTGAQSVVVSRTNNTGEMYAVAVTVTENTVGRTLLHEATAYISGDGTLNQLSVTDGSPGQNSVRYVGNFFGLNAVPAPGADSTALVDILVGSTRGAAVVRETTAGQGSRPVGFSDGTSDDRASLGVAFRVMLDQFVGQAWPFGIYYSAQMRGPFWMDTARGAIIGVDWNADPAAWYTTDGGDSWTKSVLENVTIEGIAACFDGEVFGDNGTLIHVAYTCSTEQDLSVAQFDLATMTWSAVVDLNTALGAANYNSPIIQKTQGGSWYVSCHNTGATRYAYRNSGDFLTSGDWSAATSPWEADGSLDYARAFCGDTDDPDDFGIIFHDITAAEISIKMYDWGTDTWTEQVFQTSLTYQNYTTYMSVKVRHSDKRVFVVNWNASSSANLITRRFLPTTSDATALTITTNTNNVYTGATPNSCDLLIDQFSGDVYVCYGRTATSFTLYYKRSTDNGDNWGAETQYLVHTGQASYTVAAGAFGPTNGGRFAPAILRYSMNWIVVPAASSALTFHPYVPPEPVQLSGPRPFLLLEGADEPYIPVAAAVSAQRSIASVLSDLTSIPPEIEDEGFAVPPLTPAALSLELFPATQQGFIDRMSALRTIAGVLLDLTSITPEVEDQQSVRRALELKWQEYPDRKSVV